MKDILLEELIYEYFTLQGFLCLRNLPGKPKIKGGRDEIDLIAVKIEKNNINKIIWIEVTSYLSGGKKSIKQKFSQEKENYVRKFLKSMYGIDYNNTIKKILFTSHEHTKIKEDKSLPAKVITRKDVLENIPNLIKKYQEKYREFSGSKTKDITLPNSLKLIELIEDFKQKFN